MSSITTGTVKWFNETRGYGFIQQAEGPDVFAHQNEIKSPGSSCLMEGQSVEFELAHGQKGPHATNICLVS